MCINYYSLDWKGGSYEKKWKMRWSVCLSHVKKNIKNPRSDKNRKKSNGVVMTLARWGQKNLPDHLGYKTSMKTQRLPPARQRKSDEHLYRS